MSDSTKMSRRAWFRLRPADPQPEPPPAADRQHSAAVGENAAGMANVPAPPNHDGMDLSELPPMREARLSVEQVGELISDIQQLGTDIQLMQRSSGARRATISQPEAARNLQAAKTLLLSGSVGRIQIRYRWQNTRWIDTLEASAGGYRIVRIAHADAP